MMIHSLEKFGDIVPGAFGPFPGEGIIVQHAGHDVVHARAVPEARALGIVVVRHVESEIQPG